MEFYGYKKRPTINIAIMCDADRNVVWMSNCFTGRTHDSNIMKNSSITYELSKPNPSFLRGILTNYTYIIEGGYIIADLGFACSGKIIRSFSKRETRNKKEKEFNNWFMDTRKIVEHTIGDVKATCRALKYGPRTMDEQKMSNFVHAAFVLHMIRKRHEVKMGLKRETPYSDYRIHPSLRGKVGTELRDAVIDICSTMLCIYLFKQRV